MEVFKLDDVNRDIYLKKDITWEIKKEINYDPKSETFLDYIKREKNARDKFRSIKELVPIIIILVGLFFVLLYSTLMLTDFILTFFFEGQFVGPPDLQSDFFSLLVITSIFSSVLGQILVISTLSFKYFFTRDNWSKFHDQTIFFAERLAEVNLLDEYIQYDVDKDGQEKFTLKKLSVDFQVQWIFPFIFKAFPPLLIEIMVIAFILPFSLATLFSMMIALIEANWFIAIGMFAIMILIFIGIYSNTLTIFRSWSKYSWIRNLMISRQQRILHSLVLTGGDDLAILRNESNLTRLESMHPFPLPSLFRITAFIPLIGSLLGYLVGFVLLV